MTVEMVPPALRQLWRQRARLLASNVATDSREHREIAHAAALIRQDYHDRFLVELLQNANDQAILGGARDSTAVVIRSERLLAVSNGGQPITARNLERLSSLADSDKTGVLVGNKGVGFKAVYQVTDAPEIYSAAETSASGDVLADFALGFALHQHPFSQPELLRMVEDDIRLFFAENVGLATELTDRGLDPVEAVRAEFPRVAGFKFPLPRTQADFSGRLSELTVPESMRQLMRTLVVLPLRDQSASGDVERALDRLIATGEGEAAQAELAVLFLPGVSKVIVIDHVRDLRWVCSREFRDAHNGVTEAAVAVEDKQAPRRITRFWMLQREALDAASPKATARRGVIADALADFGLEAWSLDDPLPVTVALPIPREGDVSKLGPAGRFCLGLPTQQSTGLPAHVDARFFATISRTGLDFGLPYNAMLLEVAAEIFGDLLARLCESTRIEVRRAVTLALHRSGGALADRVFSAGGIADGDVVLVWGGTHFAPRSACRLPGKEERALLPFLKHALEDDTRLDQLPEEELLVAVPDVLESIGLPQLESSPHPWLDRRSGAQSVVESSARHHRADGPEYWEGFAATLLDCFNSAALQEQTWLPVGIDELAAPSRRVFLPTPVDTRADEDEVTDVPPRVATMIRLLDGGVMRLREDGRILTKLALRLAEEGFVRRPRRTELLEDALFPALANAATTDSELALDLFGQAVAWIATMRDASRRRLNYSEARVPVSVGQGIRWYEAPECYLGEGWGLQAEQDDLLSQAYPGRRLLPFSVIRDRFRLSDATASSWRAALS